VNAWQRQHALARTTTAWAAVSIVAGAVLAARPDPWRRAFGRQHLGWGVVDLGIVAVANRLQSRRMRRLANPYAPAELQRERRRLRIILGVNVLADAGYLVGGIALWRRPQPPASGAGAAIALQGGFLLLHDAYHLLDPTT
jgi:hypothetical protein